jgi:type III pantothenate kinase
MLLAIEVGNTSAVLAVSSGEKGWSPSWRVVSDGKLTADDWSVKIGSLAATSGLDLSLVQDVVISSVVPAISSTLVRWSEAHLSRQPLMVSHLLDLGIGLDVETPNEMGADRICNAVAAWNLAHEAAIVVDTGTATKVEAISADGVFLGGAIAVGLSLSLEALAGRAARLYSVPLEPSPRVIGKNTVDSVQAGIVQGHAHMIEGSCRHFAVSSAASITFISPAVTRPSLPRCSHR